MTKAAEIIAALLSGKPPLVVERRSGMVYGWGLWMRALPDRLGTISSDLVEAMVDLLADRPLRSPPPRVAALGRWRAFRSLFYPHWDPPPREERGLRWLAGSLSLLLHLLFVLLLVMVALVRVPPPPPEASDSSRVQVQLIGEGTPEEQGGGAPEALTDPEQASAAQAAPAQPTTPQVASSESAQAPPVPQREQPQPSPPAAQQTLQVTETLTPTSDFLLPPTTPRTPEFVPPQITAPELGIPTREVTVVQAPPAQRQLPQREIAVPRITEPVVELREREIPAPLPQIRSVQVPTRAITVPEVTAPTTEVREVEIATRTPASGASRAASSAPVPGSTGAARAPDDSRGTQPGATATGPVTGGRAGALPSPRRGDDWGDSTRDMPGTPGDGAGLFNADGSVRLPSEGGAGRARQAGPPGSRQAQQADADRASKWLERQEYPYEPTMFDKYWVPNESLLAEWVRRAIREVEVPIPGTSKKVRCVVSVLQVGGACGLYDPDLNEQPAGARPPPDIPIKRNPIPADS